MKEKTFEEKLRELIVPDTSNWKSHPEFDREHRTEYIKTQRLLCYLLGVIEDDPSVTKESVQQELELNPDDFEKAMKGQHILDNFSLRNLEMFLEQRNVQFKDA